MYVCILDRTHLLHDPSTVQLEDLHTVYCCFTYIEPTNIEERTSPLLLLFAGGYRGTLFDTVCSTMLYIPYPVSNYPIIT